jgi:broad specificity phosphatase PhoE
MYGLDIVMCRHGESEANAAGLCQGFSPGKLTPAGRQQAVSLGRDLFMDQETYPFDAIWCSDLSRVQETLLLAMQSGKVEHLQNRIHYSELLREKSAGALDGKPRQLMEKARRAHGNDRTFRPEGGECWDDLQLRTQEFMSCLTGAGDGVPATTASATSIATTATATAAAALLGENESMATDELGNSNKRILVFTSGGFIKEFINQFIYHSIQPRKLYPNCAANCSTYVFCLQQSGTVDIVIENRKPKRESTIKSVGSKLTVKPYAITITKSKVTPSNRVQPVPSVARSIRSRSSTGGIGLTSSRKPDEAKSSIPDHT